MKQQVARDLLPLVNDAQDMASFEAYLADRIGELQKELETVTDMEVMLRVQGRIMELRRFNGFRDRVIQEAGDGRTS